LIDFRWIETRYSSFHKKEEKQKHSQRIWMLALDVGEIQIITLTSPVHRKAVPVTGVRGILNEMFKLTQSMDQEICLTIAVIAIAAFLEATIVAIPITFIVTLQTLLLLMQQFTIFTSIIPMHKSILQGTQAHSNLPATHVFLMIKSTKILPSHPPSGMEYKKLVHSGNNESGNI